MYGEPMMSATQLLRRPKRNPHMRIIASFLCIFCTLPLPASAFPISACHRRRRRHHACDSAIRLHRNTFAIKTKRVNGYHRSSLILQDHSSVSLYSDDSDEQVNQSSQPSDATTTTPFVGLPSYSRILTFVAATFLIWVSEPLLSLVDSAAVGRYAGKTSGTTNLSSVVQLAALGPATTVCDSCIYLTLFLSMAATNKLAKAFAKEDLKKQIQTLSHVLGASLAVGALLLVFIIFRGESLLAAVIGPAGATISVETARGAMKSIDLTQEVLRASLDYTRIRSVVTPIAVMGMTSQAALLCAQDTRTPALAVLVASVVNIVGDYFFVAKMRWGIRGAAIATSLASLLSNGMLVGQVSKMMNGWKNAYRETMKIETDYQNDERDPLSIPFISLPDRKSLVSLLLLAGPMFFVMVGKIAGYFAMTVRAGSFGMVALACHSVLTRMFFFLNTLGDAVSQSAQTYLPGLLYQKKLLEKEAREGGDVIPASTSEIYNARTLVKRLLLISSVIGIANCVNGQFISKNAGRAFTNDASLASLMSQVSPLMGLSLVLHPLTMCLEGAIIAASDTGYLVGTYVVSILVLLGQLSFCCKDFMGVWYAMLMFQFIRLIQFGSRAWRLTAPAKAKVAR
jgi:Na+-driven multidrug efflux pump